MNEINVIFPVDYQFLQIRLEILVLSRSTNVVICEERILLESMV